MQQHTTYKRTNKPNKNFKEEKNDKMHEERITPKPSQKVPQENT